MLELYNIKLTSYKDKIPQSVEVYFLFFHHKILRVAEY